MKNKWCQNRIGANADTNADAVAEIETGAEGRKRYKILNIMISPVIWRIQRKWHIQIDLHKRKDNSAIVTQPWTAARKYIHIFRARWFGIGLLLLVLFFCFMSIWMLPKPLNIAEWRRRLLSLPFYESTSNSTHWWHLSKAG